MFWSGAIVKQTLLVPNISLWNIYRVYNCTKSGLKWNLFSIGAVLGPFQKWLSQWVLYLSQRMEAFISQMLLLLLSWKSPSVTLTFVLGQTVQGITGIAFLGSPGTINIGSKIKVLVSANNMIFSLIYIHLKFLTILREHSEPVSCRTTWPGILPNSQCRGGSKRWAIIPRVSPRTPPVIEDQCGRYQSSGK